MTFFPIQRRPLTYEVTCKYVYQQWKLFDENLLYLVYKYQLGHVMKRLFGLWNTIALSLYVIIILDAINNKVFCFLL